MEKLLFCTANFKTGRGGISSYAFDFIDAFRDVYEIVVVASGDIEESNVKVYFCDCLNFTLSNALKLMDIISKESPNIVINSAFALLSLVTPYIDNNIQVITISHFVNGRYAWYAGLNGKYADFLISLSSYGKEYIEKKFNITDKKKIQVVLNFMPEVVPTYKMKRDRLILKIIYPGGCSYGKSAEVVCKSLKLLLRTNLNFEFYWTGNTKIVGAGKKGIRTNNIEDCLPKDPRVKHIGPVNREISKQLLSDANIFLLPSRGEGFPISLIEAMRCGCIPVISNAKHGSLDAIVNGVNGFIVKQGNAHEIVSLIEYIINNHNNYSSIYENSYLYYKQNLTDSVWKKHLVEIMNGSSNHINLLEKFQKYHYMKDRFYLNFLMKRYWVYDRLTQLYHFVYFRYIKYLL